MAIEPRISKLRNGVVVATETVRHIRSASIGVYLDVGSREETPERNGIAHFFEHMVFKGTPSYSGLDIVKSFETSGGQVNAFTAKEQTCFYAKVVDREAASSLNILLDMVHNATFDPQEVVKEREVIIEEIRGGDDIPEEHVYDLFSKAYFGKASLGFPIAGYEEYVRNLERRHLLAHQRKVHDRIPMYVIAVGHIEHEEILRTVKNFFSRQKNGNAARERTKPRRPGLRPVPKSEIVHRKVQQANVILGGPCFALDDPRRLALMILNCIFGDGMSSRLFQNLREDNGLVYSIYSNPEFFINSGVFSIGFQTEPKHLSRCIKEINREISRIAKEGLSDEELAFAKRNLEGNILMSLESTQTRMGYLSRMLMYGKGWEDIHVFLDKLKLVSQKDIREILPIVFERDKWTGAAVLPQKCKMDIDRALDFG